MTVTIDPIAPPRKRWVQQIAGPNPYVPGSGFTVDLSTVFSWLDFIKLEPITVGANWERATQMEWALNNPAPGKAIVAFVKRRYNKFTSVTNGATSLPGGVSVVTVLTGTGAGGSHNHTVNHDHGTVTSPSETGTGAGVNAAVGGVQIFFHHHDFVIPSFSGNSGNEAAHVHNNTVLYDHVHSSVQAATQLSRVAYTGVDLSDTMFMLFAVGQ